MVESKEKYVVNGEAYYHSAGLLDNLGIDLETEHTRETPGRIVDAWEEFFQVGHIEPNFTTFTAQSHDMIAVGNIHFYSVCAHHMLPFFGEAWIAYIPGERIAGLSKLVRALNYFSHRMQVQEELTSQVADYLSAKLDTEHVAVILKCEHLCLSMRGANTPGHITTSAALRGAFMEDVSVKAELYALVGGKNG